ncbi:MAG TPA: hypothetical protein VN824_05210, partial [Puia sp.]|nr:hypothetical protein [Puia sp.]
WARMHLYETTFLTYTIGHCHCASSFLLYQPVVAAGDQAAGGGGSVLPFYIREFFIGGGLYVNNCGVGG